MCNFATFFESQTQNYWTTKWSKWWKIWCRLKFSDFHIILNIFCSYTYNVSIVEFHFQLKKVDFVKLAILIWMRNWTSSANIKCQTLQKVEIFGHFMNCTQQHFLNMFQFLNIFLNWFLLIREFYTEINVILYLPQSVNLLRTKIIKNMIDQYFLITTSFWTIFWFPDIQQN